MTLRAVVADDERHARADLVRLLDELGVLVVSEVSDGSSALRAIDRERPDVVFLDVRMPGLDGLSVAARGGLPPVVFVTAYAAHAPAAFDLEACDYLVKPVSRERLARAVRRVTQRVALEDGSGNRARLRVSDARGTRFIDARLVECFSAVDKYVGFTVDGEQLLLDGTLDALETRLASDGFVRVHRAHLVRIAAVARADTSGGGLVLELASGLRVPVSKRQRASVADALRRGD